MYFFGVLFVFGCVGAGYIIPGGHADVLWQPYEFLIILGAGIGSFIVANRLPMIKMTMAAYVRSMTDKCTTKKEYIELLSVLYSIFKLARTKSMLAVEPHIDKPHESSIFQKYPSFLHNHHALDLFCDYIRMISMGVEDPFIIDDLMREEVEALQHENEECANAMQTMGDSMPALGIVAAVLGVIHTMGSIDQPPAVLGHLIGAALVGTFFGILVSYGLFGPTAGRMRQLIHMDNKYYSCIKAGINAHLNNLPPIISVEAARKSIEVELRPSYNELEEAMNSIVDL